MVCTRTGNGSVTKSSGKGSGKKIPGLKKIISEVNRHGVKIIKAKKDRIDGSAGDPVPQTETPNLRKDSPTFPPGKGNYSLSSCLSL